MKRFHPLRINQETRDIVAETRVTVNDFIYPYFVVEGVNRKNKIESLDGIHHFSIDILLKDISETLKLGINNILLFGVIDGKEKDNYGTAGWNEDNLISRAVSQIKNQYPEMTVFTDVCLCGYTSHGHCGILSDERIDNDSTLPYLAKMAAQHALAGADFVAPSAMMDGQVEAIRKELNRRKLNTKILSYSAKYASGFYGPFRYAAHSAPAFGDRKSYQMDYRTIIQAVNEVDADIDEGADWVMVKPAHAYLDIIQRVKSRFKNTPLAAYQVSGEYMMIKAAAKAGYLTEEKAMHEVLTAIKRAGADKIITYYAKEFVTKGI
jgi:porphobilinogen synthase